MYHPFSPASPVRPVARRMLLLTALLLAAPAVACSGASPTGETAAAETAAATDDDNGSAAAVPPTAPVGPMASGGGQQVPTPAAGGATGELAWTLPEGWSEVPPANRMRMAQASIPGPGGPADLVLFHFGPGQGGDAQSNVQRWLGQMEIEGEPEQGSFETDGGLRVTWVDVAGTRKPSQMGTGPAEPVPGSRLLGAVVEGPGGPWFFKATGPDETLAAAREEFLAMLRAARVE